MHHALRDALAVLMGELLEQQVILDEQRAARARGDAVLVVGDRGTGRAGQCLTDGFICHENLALLPLRGESYSWLA